jgi:hypothetical protein
MDVGDAGQAVAVPLGDEMTAIGIEGMPTAERAQNLV